MPSSSAGSPLWSVFARRLPEIYAVLALLLVATYCLLIPPFFGADEIAHAERALEIAHGGWVPRLSHPGEPVTEIPDSLVVAGTPLPIRISTPGTAGYGAPIDTAFLLSGMRLTSVQRGFVQRYPVFTRRPDGRFLPGIFSQEKHVRWSGQRVFTSFRNTGSYPPLFYLPAALALGLAERFNSPILFALLAARLCTGFCAVLIGWLALRLGRRPRCVLCLLLLLPALTGIEASCSQDALLIPTAALVCSLLARAVSAYRLPRWPEWVALALLVGVCVAARPPYLPLALLLLLPPLARRSRSWQDWSPALCSLAMACVLALGWHAAVSPAGLAHSGVAQPEAQVAYLKAHPVHSAILLAARTAQKIPEMVIRSVEVLELKNPRVMAVAFGLHILGLGCALWYAPKIPLRTWPACALLWGTLASIVAGISLAEYIIWTPPGANALDGLQARYYLPLLPLAFAFRFRNSREASDPSRPVPNLLAGLGLAVFVAGVLMTPFALAHRFYATSLPTALSLWFR